MIVHEYSDEELTAYLDQEMSPKDSALLEDNLRKYPSLNDRLTDLDLIKQNLSETFEAILHGSPHFHDTDALKTAPKPTRSKFTMRVAACAGMAASVLVVSFFTWNSAELNWMHRAAIYQGLYVDETLTTLDFSDDEKLAQLSSLGAKLNLDLTAYKDIGTLKFIRAQQLGFEGSPIAHLSFLTEANEPVALCILMLGSSKETDVEYERMQGMSSAYWSTGGFEFLLIGGEDDNRLKSVIQEIGAKPT